MFSPLMDQLLVKYYQILLFQLFKYITGHIDNGSESGVVFGRLSANIDDGGTYKNI